MFHPTLNECVCNSAEADVSGNLSTIEEPSSGTEKITEDDSRNTYVIIMNKNDTKSKSVPLSKPTHGHHTLHSRSLSRCSKVQVDDLRINLKNISDDDYETGLPTQYSEDIKFNLADNNDDDYDSGLSATGVFLKSGGPSQNSSNDSAIEMDISDNNPQLHSSQSPFMLKLASRSGSYNGAHQKRISTTSQTIYHLVSPNVEKPVYTSISANDNEGTSLTDRKVYFIASANSQSVFKKAVHGRSLPSFTPSGAKFAPIKSLTSPRYRHTFTTPYTSTPVSGQPSPSNQVYIIPSPLLNHPNSTSNPRSPTNTSDSSYSQNLTPSYDTSGYHSVTDTPEFMGQEQHIIIEKIKTESMDTDTSASYRNPILITPNSASRQCYIITPPVPVSSNSQSTIVSSQPKLQTSPEAFTVNSSTHLHNSGMNVEDLVAISVDGSQTDDFSSVKSDTGQAEVKPVCGSRAFTLRREISVSSSQESMESNCTSQDFSVTSSQESLNSEKEENKEDLDDSLTNIQWLKEAQWKGSDAVSSKQSHSSKSTNVPSSSNQSASSLHWRCLSSAEIKRISEECGRHKRPPFSYMYLIQMALCSREDKRMMLKEICRWIEDTFPYYKHSKPGWKNSIRHNLSLYNIFVRESARHGSYWTLKPDCIPKAKYHRDSSHGKEQSQSLPSFSTQPRHMVPVMFSSLHTSSSILQPHQANIIYQNPSQVTSTTARKKGPLPILPRPSPFDIQPQAYALIPIQNLPSNFDMSAQTSTSTVLQLATPPPVMANCLSPSINEVSNAVASIQIPGASYTNNSDATVTKGSIKLAGTTPITQPTHSHGRRKEINIVRQAWLDAELQLETPLEGKCAVLHDPMEKEKSTSKSGRGKRSRVKIGLPRPKIYKEKTRSDKRKEKEQASKRRRMQAEKDLLEDSSDEEEVGSAFLLNLEKDFTTPMKNILDSINDSSHSLSTSTPVKDEECGPSPDFVSPIRGMTPLRSSTLFDGNFLDNLKDSDSDKGLSFSPELHGTRKYSSKISPGNSRSPNSSLLDLNVLPFFSSPDKGDIIPEESSVNGQNLSRFLAEFNIDPSLLDTISDELPHFSSDSS
ncbi:hypothetical protein ACJMK2_020250 [Sinanodonta woodiana]|uniref:Fork-head domain-containing protein n=1 Tax=Sinanodonta woodiana TaxID=1069815 RepID=A0ABD3TYK9_SINWO